MDRVSKMAPFTKKVKKKKTHEKTSQRFGYTEDALSNALSDIRGNVRSIREACRLYGVPRSTIQDRLSGRVAEQKRKVGPDPIFGFEGEKKIVDWIVELAKSGIPVSKYDLLDTVAELAKELGIDHRFPAGKPGIRWYLSFLKRHPNISIREPEAINKAREAIKESSIRKWFADLYTFLAEKNALSILEDPSRILNADETGVSLSPKSGKVLAPKGYKNVYVIKKGNEKENITVLVVMTASGEICPPLVVFPYIRPPKAVVDNMPPDWILGKSETGWMRSDIFFEYMSNGFKDWLTKRNVTKPVLFLVDGHKSHMSMPLSKFCEDNNIILYALPPNTTHILQPADVSVFKPLKQEWKRTVKNWQSRSENLNKCITKTNFCQVFKETLDKEMTQTIKNGFRKCGLYPFDVEQVDFSKCVKDAQIRNTTAVQTNAQKPLNERHFEIARQVFHLMEENIAKLGISPSLILQELDRTKKSYLHKRRSKSKTPRTSQSNSTTRHSKSFEVNKSSDNISKTPGTLQSTSTPKDSESCNPKISSDITSNSPRTSEKYVKDINNSFPIPDIGSFVSLDGISITPFSDIINLSEICQVNDEIVVPFDTAVDDVNHAEPSGKDVTVELIQDDANTESATITDKNQLLNTVVSVGAYNCLNSSIEDNAPNPPVIISEENPFQDRTTYDLNVASSALEIGTFNAIRLDENDSGILAEKQPELYTELNRTYKKPAITNKIGDKENDILASVSQKSATFIDEIEDPFQKHLKFPVAITKNKGSRTSNQFPSAISSEAWRQYYEKKEKEKQDKDNRIKKRKLERELKKKELPQKKKRMNIKTEIIKKKKVDETQSRVKCGSCDLDLISDTEEEGEKNIGCDHCIRWYHLKCTKLNDLSYNQAASAPYQCMLCETTQNAREEILKMSNDNTA